MLYLEYKNGWFIRTASKSFAVYAATQTEKKEWMAHIKKCIEDLLRKSKIDCIFKPDTNFDDFKFLRWQESRRSSRCRLGAGR